MFGIYSAFINGASKTNYRSDAIFRDSFHYSYSLINTYFHRNECHFQVDCPYFCTSGDHLQSDGVCFRTADDYFQSDDIHFQTDDACFWSDDCHFRMFNCHFRMCEGHFQKAGGHFQSVRCYSIPSESFATMHFACDTRSSHFSLPWH